MAIPPELITMTHTPASHSVHVALYRNVKNAAFLLQQLLDGNTEYEYALIDARVIISRIHLLAACFRAISNQLLNKLRTRNVHSEIVFSLSPNKNIASSLSNFGIASETSGLLVIKVNPVTERSSITAHLGRVIDGEPVNFCDSELARMTDWARVRKLYKLDASAVSKKKSKTSGPHGSMEQNDAEVLILGAMALKGSLN
ncbi:hypothetical protein K3495_g5177 [Podosphaera aphanis]|nr:hypothetical protein K3495_g5177 [Podosphaera aphanis]